ncbi:gliding motility-associated peptidyl-prolyl isomerase GldI [Ulvibacterium sp.]|uniref:gliding motility-associated peptidyl-prolyl isomerase GldI n=1 Tax=Ulvibacterium sp. TaxID=2665914 RepID=UPI002622525F|nr:gliding motility-associated peptidyl-prolyl isomerase GldI [Ulvibacterium sp.]
MKYLWLILLVVVFFGCGGPEPRRPIQAKTSSFFKESIERSKKLLEIEEKLIADIIAKDSFHDYNQSASGSWYFYKTLNENTEYTPQSDDLVTMTYDILSLSNDTIYSAEAIGIVQYKVDKQELFPGLRNSVKLLKEKETATFLYPSSLAYGYHGDNNKIGINVPIKSTLSILKIQKQQDSLK